MNSDLLISISLFVSQFIFILGLYYYFSYLKRRRALIQKISFQGTDTREAASDLDAPAVAGSVKSRAMRVISALGNYVKAKHKADPLQTRLTFLQAGYQNRNAPVLFFGVKGLLGILLLLAMFSFGMILRPRIGYFSFMCLSIVIALVGFYLPNLWLYHKISTRKEKVQEGFPDALDLLVVCVEAGMGLDAAFVRVAEEIRLEHKELGEELRLFNLEMKAGKARRDALRSLALRTGLEDISSLTTLLMQSEKFGTGIAQALRIHSDFMRTKRFQRAEELAAKLPVKLVIPLILFILPALLIVVLGPAVIRIYRNILVAF